MATLNFDATQVSPSDSYDPIPAAWYNAMIVGSEMKPTKDGLGSYLNLQFRVIDGEYANRTVFTRLNLQNASPVTQEIAYKQLSAIAHAVGILHVQQSEQLHGIPLMIKVKYREAKDGYDASNEVGGYKAIAAGTGSSAPAAMQPPAMVAAPQMAAPMQAPVQAPVQPITQAPMQAPVQQPVQFAQQPAVQQPAQPVMQAPQADVTPPWLRQQ